MGYRDTGAQSEARLSELRGELEAMREQLVDVGRRVENHHRQHWGWLGVLWFRSTLRRSLHDVNVSMRHNGTPRAIARSVRGHERALEQGRGVLRWLEATLEVEDEPEDDGPSIFQGLIDAASDVLALIGAALRGLWSLARPVLIAVGVVSGVFTIVALFFAEREMEATETGQGMSSRVQVDGRREADVELGFVALGSSVVVIAAGMFLWWLRMKGAR